jgi:hypothetical protein
LYRTKQVVNLKGSTSARHACPPRLQRRCCAQKVLVRMSNGPLTGLAPSSLTVEFSPCRLTARAVGFCQRIALGRGARQFPFRAPCCSFPFLATGQYSVFGPVSLSVFRNILNRQIFPPPPVVFSPCSRGIQHRWRQRGADSLWRERAVSISSALSSEARVNLIRRSQVSIWDLVGSLISHIWLDVVVTGRFCSPARFVSTAYRKSMEFV